MTERTPQAGSRAIVSSPHTDGSPSLVLEPATEGNGGSDGLKSKGNLEPIRPELPSQKKPRRFGLFPQLNPARTRSVPIQDESIRVEPRNDPAADAALKRKLEAKVIAAVGDKAKNVEVRVVDRNVVVKAKVDHFWNRRSVRRTIETLPALSGYRAKVEVDD